MRAVPSALLAVAQLAASDHACNFTLDSLEFNLCPLFSVNSAPISFGFGEATPPTFTAYRYQLGVPLKRDTSLPAELQCPEGSIARNCRSLNNNSLHKGTWICLTVENRRPGSPSEEPLRILQVVPVAGNQDLGLNPQAKMLAKVQPDDLHEPLQVTLHGGLYKQQPQKASFEFHCDHSLKEPTEPRFSSQWNGTHTFSWRTKHACPRALPPGAPGPRPGEPGPASPVDPDADVDDGEPVARPASVSTLGIFVWCSMLVTSALWPCCTEIALYRALLGLRFLYPFLSRWSRLWRSRFSTMTRKPMARSKRFRPSAISLVQWAAEEAPEEYAEEDGCMHSFSDGEEIPLTPNSRTSFSASQYGSAGRIANIERNRPYYTCVDILCSDLLMLLYKDRLKHGLHLIQAVSLSENPFFHRLDF
ncbi:hypothetical protein K438DRAFT_779396 [Mycena galopus ATCC 62051]|nr:hypothetical protein K438DRAFT_779396 [Mycena galopus ATCC 62051]